jgi:PAS domain S-box-containing protein
LPRSIEPPLVELILDAVADGLFTVDETFRITRFNRAAEEITGYSQAEAVGVPCHEIFRTSLCRRRCPLKESLQTGRTVKNREIDIRTRDDEARTICVNTAALQDGEGRLVGAVETFRDLTRLHELERELADRDSFRDIVSRNPAIRSVIDRLPLIARSDATVLIEGASGTGKGLFAKAVHELSERAGGPFVHVNCAAIPEGLLEAELFGHVRGAFTDAQRDRMGRFEAGRGGTVFLDEIGDAPLTTQVKLLRVLQEREYEPVGSSETVKADVRIVAATNRDLGEAIRVAAFREDLYYRLSVFRLEIPPLSERPEDVPLLAQHFVHAFNRRTGARLRGFSNDALRLMMAWPYPGNVRELENVVEHACIVSKSARIGAEDLPDALRAGQPPPRQRRPRARVSVTRERLIELLEQVGGNVPRLAEALGVHRTTAWRMLKREGLRVGEAAQRA